MKKNRKLGEGHLPSSKNEIKGEDRMRITCEIIKDLLPLYHDNVCSEDSRKLIEEHLSTCERCRDELKEIDLEIKAVKNTEDVKIMNNIAKKWKQDRLSSFFSQAHSFFFYYCQCGVPGGI